MVIFVSYLKNYIMAKSYNNEITKNYHGRMGDIVFRCIGDLSIMAKCPDCSKVIRTEAQKVNQSRFSAAVKYARGVLNDQKKKAYYEKRKRKHQSVWNLAISDYMSKPKIDEVDLSGYRGRIDDLIKIKARDRYRIETVTVDIKDMNGNIVESGFAKEGPISGGYEWEYRASIYNTHNQAGTITVTAKDLPGNVVKREIPISIT